MAADSPALSPLVSAYDFEAVVPEEGEIVVAEAEDVVVRDGGGEVVASGARVTVTTYAVYMHGEGRSGAWVMPFEKVVSFRGSSSFLARYSKIFFVAKSRRWDEYDLRFSFHGHGYKNMLAQLESTFKMRLWVGRPAKKKKGGARGGERSGGGGFSTRSAGVSGIMRRVEREAREDESTLAGAFEDVETLMVKAREVVRLAERVKAAQERAARARRRESSEAEAADEVDLQNHLMALGMGSITAPSVSRNAATSASAFHVSLARELARFLAPILADPATRGVLPLTDVYCLYNRARGTDLVSPDDVLAAVAAMGSLRPPVGMALREFASGAKVVQSDAHSDDAVVAHLLEMLDSSDHGVSAAELADSAKLSLMLARQHLLKAEEEGLVCRDASPKGLFFWQNMFAA